MELRKVRGWEGDILVEPIGIHDFAMFRHCSGGFRSVTTNDYKTTVEPLLFAHGVTCISIEPLPRKKKEKP